MADNDASSAETQAPPEQRSWDKLLQIWRTRKRWVLTASMLSLLFLIGAVFLDALLPIASKILGTFVLVLAVGFGVLIVTGVALIAGQITLTTQTVVHRQVLFIAFFCFLLGSTYEISLFSSILSSVGVSSKSMTVEQLSGLATIIVIIATISYFGNLISDAAKSWPEFEKLYKSNDSIALFLMIGLYRTLFDVLLPMGVAVVMYTSHKLSAASVAKEIGCALFVKTSLSPLGYADYFQSVLCQ